SLAERWQKVIAAPKREWNFQQIPGELEKLAGTDPTKIFTQIVYVIWKNPWMSVAKETFIGSMLIKMGAENLLPIFEKKYPNFEMSDFNLKQTYFLFSSEPFPFHKKKADLEKMGVQGGVIDGESYSWFGIRALEFVEKIISSS